MQNYQIRKTLGSGAYGTVFLAFDIENNREVALKQIHKKTTWSDAKNQVELRSLKRFKNCQYIVQLYELFRETDGTLNFVFEYVKGGSICSLSQSHPLDEKVVQKAAFHIVSGLNIMHQQGYMHRDLKPENVLISSDGIFKIADLGCAKELRRGPHSIYVGTRWYRSPEILLQDQNYTQASDIFAFGLLLCEMLLGRPLLPGNSEIDQINLILQVLGPISNSEWPKFNILSSRIGFVSSTPCSDGTGEANDRIKKKLQTVLRNVGNSCVDFISKCLIINPENRSTASQLLDHQFLQQFSSAQVESRDQDKQLLYKAKTVLNGKAMGIGEVYQNKHVKTADLVEKELENNHGLDDLDEYD